MTEAEVIDRINSTIKKNGKNAITGEEMNFVLKAIIQLIADSGGVVNWGDIEGTITDQLDLASALNGKQNSLGFIPENVSNKSTDVNTDQASNTKYPTVKAVFDWANSAISWIATNGANVLSHLSNTNNPHSTTATQVDALKRDGSNANSDVDLGTFSLNTKSVKVNGTAGEGHVGLKHQSSGATASGQETVIFAGADGEPRFKNDGNAIEQIASREWVGLQGFQTTPIVVSSNTTAQNDRVYHVIANATFTDPTPVEGRGYVVFVRNGTATIGGNPFSTSGNFIYRLFNSGVWALYPFGNINSLSTIFNAVYVPQTRTINGLDLSTNRTLTTANINDSTDKRYVTDAEKTVIGNTSGTNTGDQTLSGLGGVPTSTTITINGTTQDLSANRTFSAVMLMGLPGVANVGTSGAIRYFAFSGVASVTAETTRRIIICNDVTLKNFYIYTSTAQPATGSHVLTVLKNGVATGITITIPAGSAAGLFSDTTNSETFAQGDAISIQAVNNASTNSGTIVSLQIGNL